MQQRTEEWLAARAGSLGASSLWEAVTKTRNGYSASRSNLLARLAVERLTGQPCESYTSDAMRHGTDTEPEARDAYAFYRNVEVEEVGLVPHPSIEGSHASPDGLVEVDGLVEIKCPNSATHMDFLLTGEIPEKYTIQMFWQMACTGRKWCDFVSFDPRFPEEMRLRIKRLERDETRIAELEKEVTVFLEELDCKLMALRESAKPKPAKRKSRRTKK